MRRAKLTVGIAAVVIALAGVTTAAIRHGDPSSDRRIQRPTLSYEQTPAAITVRIHNPNRHHGLRDQHVRITLYQSEMHPFHTYGPDEYDTVEGRPELGRKYCCVITELRPGGDYSFELFPSTRFTVNAVKIDVIGPPGWIEM